MRLRQQTVRLIFFGFAFVLALTTTVSFIKINQLIDTPVLDQPPRENRCALLFFGLPRGYKTLVLPSIVKNVLEPNSKHGCDIYAHSVILQKEEASRSGRGGTIDPKSIFLLEQRTQEVSAKRSGKVPHVAITTDTEEDFWRIRNETVQKYRTTKGADGKLLYFPWARPAYIFPTSIDSMVKQWHSIETVWHLMEEESKKLQVTYDRVAMLRNDVFYAAPIDIYQTSSQDAVLPGFAMYPVNDRMIYGPYSAVKIWATERFQRIDSHVRKVQPGLGMHSEWFLKESIIPAIVETGTKVVMNYDICFFRVRADETVWISDCERTGKNAPQGIIRDFRKVDKKRLVENIVGLPCTQSKGPYQGVMQLECRDQNQTSG